MRTSREGIYRRFGKPLLDRTVGVVLTILTLPVMLGLLMMAWVVFGLSPLLRVSRAGRNDIRFDLYRVNTRKDDQTDLRGRSLRLSRWLRSTSLDELPQLWNVALGHMSLIGPRPLDPQVALELDQTSAGRHVVRPGLTGPWQLEARGDGRELTDHFAVDLSYIEQLSLKTDLALLTRTVPALWQAREEV